jgi:hypothetical protein
MSTGKWKRDPLTGMRDSQKSQLKVKNLPKTYPDCDTFDLKTIADVSRYSVRYLSEVVFTDGSSDFHVHKIRGANNVVLGYATNTVSAKAGGERRRERTLEIQRKGGYPKTDVSAASSAQIALEALTGKPCAVKSAISWQVQGGGNKPD